MTTMGSSPQYETQRPEMGPQHEMRRVETSEMGPYPAQRRRMGPRLWFGAFAFGAAVGGVLGLLFAPRKGRETREALSESLAASRGVSAEWQRRMNEMIRTGRATPADLALRTQRELDELRARAINRIGDAKLRAAIMQKEAELRYLRGKEKIRGLTH